MYEPYPHTISKVKLTLLILIPIILFGNYILLKTTSIAVYFPANFIDFLIWLRYVLLLGLVFFNWKTFTLVHSREYIYLVGGISSFLFFDLVARFYLVNLLSLKKQPLYELNFFLTGGLVLFIFYLLAAFNTEKIISPQRRKKIAIQVIFSTILTFVMISMLEYYLLAFQVSHHDSLEIVSYILTCISLFVLSLTIIWIIKAYYKTRYNIYFWFVVPLIFFFFSVIYLFSYPPEVRWEQASLILQILGFVTMVWVPFVEHTRFMESEIKLRRSLERSLFQSERNLETYSNLVNKVDVGICTFDEKCRIIFANEKLAAILGFVKERLIDRDVKELFDARNLEKFQLEFEKWKTGVSSQFEIEIRTRRKENIPIMISAVPVFDLRERFTGSRMVIFEISAWKEMERKLLNYSENLKKMVNSRNTELEKKTEELKQAKNYYETLISGMLDIILVFDKKGNCTFMNNYGKKLLGYSINELKSQKLPDFFTDLDQLRKNYGDAMKVELRDYEAEIMTKDGRRILCSWNVRYLFDPDNQHIGAICVGRDISEFKALQRRLEQQTQNLEKLVAERTNELNARIDQLSRILQIGEKITLNIDIGKILSHICQAIKDIGWRIVILSLKNQNTTGYRIVAYAGITKSRIRNFVNERNYIFEHPFNLLQDDSRISQSYLIRNANEKSMGAQFIKLKASNNANWHKNDVLIIPIKIQEKIFGFVNIFEPMAKNYPDEQHIQLLEIFVHKAAFAIENRRLLEETESRARELARVNKVKSDFFTTMSHELRTPLNSIITLTGVLLKKMAGDLNPEQLKQIQIIQQNGENLLKLINNILDLSKIEAGRMEVNYSYFSLSQLIEQTIESIRPLCDRKKLKLELKQHKKLPAYLFSDREKINQVLTNILGNAIKFTEKGKIVVTVKPENRNTEIHFSVADKGIGMDQDEIAHIFQVFKQLDTGDKRRFEGTGLGLSIAKQQWTLLGGTISVQSKKGKGTTFHLVLPVKKVTEKEKNLSLQPSRVMKIDTSPALNIRRRNANKPLILLVDDNQDNQYAVKFILEDKGYRVVFARNGAEGIEKAVKLKPDLILMDMMMPDVDGYQATQKIRRSKALKDIPIIAMTAKSPQEDKQRAIKAGCNEYLTKPFNLDDILKTVNRWLG